MPCADAEVCNETNVEQLACEGLERNEIGDLCSPFCHCQCCSIHYTSFEIRNYNIAEPFITQHKFVFMDVNEQEFLRLFIQPPIV